MKNNGFSLIEITVAIALVGVMAGVGIPKLRRSIAIGRDTKAIATLGVLRTASELYFAEKEEAPHLSGEDDITSLKKLEDYLDPKTFKEIEDGKISIGGCKSEENIIYGGEISFTFTNPIESKSSDGIYIWFSPIEGLENDTKGNKWIEY